MQRQRLKLAVSLALPCVLAGVLWGINWKRQHPTASAFDLRERALLRRATSVHLEVVDKTTWIEKTDWSNFLNDFYVMPTNQSPQNFKRWVLFDAEFTDDNARRVGNRTLQLDPCSGRATYNSALPDGTWGTFELHPVTLQALKKLINKRPKEAAYLEMMRPGRGCP